MENQQKEAELQYSILESPNNCHCHGIGVLGAPAPVRLCHAQASIGKWLLISPGKTVLVPIQILFDRLVQTYKRICPHLPLVAGGGVDKPLGSVHQGQHCALKVLWPQVAQVSADFRGQAPDLSQLLG